MNTALELVGAVGVPLPSDLRPEHIMRRVSPHKAVSYRELFPTVEPGSLLTGDAPADLQVSFPKRRRDLPLCESSCAPVVLPRLFTVVGKYPSPPAVAVLFVCAGVLGRGDVDPQGGSPVPGPRRQVAAASEQRRGEEAGVGRRGGAVDRGAGDRRCGGYRGDWVSAIFFRLFRRPSLLPVSKYRLAVGSSETLGSSGSLGQGKGGVLLSFLIHAIGRLRSKG